jgi:hypothetical protein
MLPMLFWGLEGGVGWVVRLIQLMYAGFSGWRKLDRYVLKYFRTELIMNLRSLDGEVLLCGVGLCT